MKILKVLAVFMVAGLFLVGCEDEMKTTDQDLGQQEMLLKVTGNGSLSGPHYELNLIGVDKAKTTTLDDNNGHRIFVWLNDYSKIELIEGDEFAVLDANATDGDAAQFQLPDPGLDPYNIGDPGDADTESNYSVYIRPLGKPGGSASITTCAELMDSDFAGLLSGKFVRTLNRAGYFGGLASMESVALALPLGSKGKPKFENVTAELLTIVFKVEVDLDPDPDVENLLIEYIRVPIFNDIIDGEYWEVDNDGLKLVKIRFYPGVSTDVTYADDPWK